MKINTKNASLKALFICCALSYKNSLYTFFHNSIEDNFIKKIHNLEHTIDEAFHDLNQACFDTITMQSQPHTLQNRSIIQLHDTQDNSTRNFFQKSCSCLSFSNQEKSITLTDEKNSSADIYTINITEKQEPIEQDIDMIQALENLKDYIQAKFNNQQAILLLKTCIDELQKDETLQSIVIESTQSGNQITYNIEIPKESQQAQDSYGHDFLETVEDEESASHKNRKKKKSQDSNTRRKS